MHQKLHALLLQSGADLVHPRDICCKGNGEKVSLLLLLMMLLDIVYAYEYIILTVGEGERIAGGVWFKQYGSMFGINDAGNCSVCSAPVGGESVAGEREYTIRLSTFVGAPVQHMQRVVTVNGPCMLRSVSGERGSEDVIGNV